MAENRNREYQQGRPARARVAATNQVNVVCREHGDNSHAAAVAVPPLFRGIPPGDIAKICTATRVKQFARGQMLHIEGEYVQKVLLITSGFVKITQYGLSGAEVILRLEAPGAVLGAEGLYSCGRYGTTAQAHRPCRALVWESLAFKALIEPHLPVLQQNMIRLLRDQLRELEERFREVATERVAARVACQLARLPRKIGHLVNGVVEIGLSREDLAHMTGTTLFTVSRLFSNWEAQGVITSRREAVAICDLGSLRALSEGDCPPFSATGASVGPRCGSPGTNSGESKLTVDAPGSSRSSIPGLLVEGDEEDRVIKTNFGEPSLPTGNRTSRLSGRQA